MFFFFLPQATSMVASCRVLIVNNRSQPFWFPFLSMHCCWPCACVHQVVLLSATMPVEVLEVTKKFMRDPIQILVKKEELTLEGIRQFYINVEREVRGRGGAWWRTVQTGRCQSCRDTVIKWELFDGDRGRCCVLSSCLGLVKERLWNCI